MRSEASAAAAQPAGATATDPVEAPPTRATGTTSPLPLIYILSSGRSGSTLLDQLLGLDPAIWTLGELQVLPWELREQRAPCGCGVPLERCRFFGPLLTELPLASDEAKLEHFREAHGFGRVWRRGLVGDLLLGRPRGARRGPARAYGELNRRLLARLFQAAHAQSPVPLRYLVDSSKDPYRLAWLAASGHFALKVVHIYKDPRAFVHSMTRREGARLSTTLRFTLRWIIENGLMAYQGATLPTDNFFSLNYATLAGDPEKALANLGRFLGIRFAPGLHERLRERELHAVSGNEMRWQQDALSLDQRWRSDMPAWARWLTSALTWPWWALLMGRTRNRVENSPQASMAGTPSESEAATASPEQAAPVCNATSAHTRAA
jgi:Sulfotransferase family